MKLFLFFSFLLFMFCFKSFSQANGSLTGTAFDTTMNKPVADATVTVLARKDSVLVTFTMADNNGKFSLQGLKDGEYRLLITHINYYSSNSFFSIDKEHRNIDVNIFMYDKSKVLKEVSVTAESSPVTLIGDTIQYNAGSFKTLPNANVEDLLKKLPGVRVDKNGTVKAQGEKVQKVLVDGKEFFGNDPKIATKNLPADAIDKVQVFDKLSDQAQMTGFDDGNSQKTINLTLKKDKKKGAFGKINAGAGTGERYQGKLNVNSFKGAKQMSAIGMANNTNAEGFSFFDILIFTGALNQLKNGGSMMNISISQDDPLAGLLGGNNTGINTTWGGGVNYNNIIGAKTDFQGNYFYNRFNPVRKSNVQRQYFSPANLYRQNSYTDNLNNSNRLNASADYQVDSFNSIKISTNLNYQNTSNRSNADYTTLSDQGKNINEGHSNSLSNSDGTTLSANILFRRKFRQKRRSFSLNLLTNFNNSEGNGSLNSFTNFYNAGGSLFQRDSVNQVNNNAESLQGFNAKAVYTEPLFKKSMLEFSVGKSYTINTVNKTTYDYNHDNKKFDIVNKFLTSNFENTYNYTTAGLRLRKQGKRYNYAAGAMWQQAMPHGKIISAAKDSSIKKSFTNVLPNARFQYNFSRFKNVMLNYSAGTTQPTINQLQPLTDNSNPLYIKQGNPDLKQEFTHSLKVNASFVNPFTNKNFFVFFTLQQTQNKIVNYDRINNIGIDSVTYINANGVFNMDGNLSYGFPVHFLKGTLDVSSDVSRYHDKQFINGQINIINTTTVAPEIRLDMNPSDKLNLSFTTGIKLSNTKYSLQSARTARYFTREYGTEAGWQLPKGFFFASDFNYRLINQYENQFNAKIPLWNASLSKQMLHFSRGELKLSANDILNRNLAINRSANQNYIEDTRVNNLRRFFLLSFTYNLTKTGLNNSENGGGLRIINK